MRQKEWNIKEFLRISLANIRIVRNIAKTKTTAKERKVQIKIELKEKSVEDGYSFSCKGSV